MLYRIFIPLLFTLLFGCTSVLKPRQVAGREELIKVHSVAGIPVKEEILPSPKEKKEIRLEERLNRPVEIVNWASLGVGLAAVAGCCLVQAPVISKRLGIAAMACGICYAVTLGLMLILDLLVNPVVRISLGAGIVALSVVLARRFWLRGCILKKGCSSCGTSVTDQ